MSGRRSNRGGFGLMLLASQILHIGPDRIPPVTLLTVIINVVIYMRLIPNLPSVDRACTSNNLVINKKQWMRLCTSSFYHLDDMHLYYNMVSFIWKGLTLERKMKSKKFFIVIALFSVSTQVVMLIVNRVFSEIFTNNHYLRVCAAGFSAVLFALKVLTTYNSDRNVGVMGLPITVPSKYACWVELVLIHVLVPNSSFTGHLSGILVGLMYTHGPLRKVVKGLKYLISGDLFQNNTPRATYTRQAEATGYRQAEATGYRQADDDSVEVQRAIQESMQNTNYMNPSGGATQARNHPPSYGWNISGEPENRQNTLYPNLANEAPGSSRYAPSTPPFNADSYHENNSGRNVYSPPYPTTSTASNLPYPPTNINNGNIPFPSYIPVANVNNNNAEETHSNESSEEVMRKARLRKFTKN